MSMTLVRAYGLDTNHVTLSPPQKKKNTPLTISSFIGNKTKPGTLFSEGKKITNTLDGNRDNTVQYSLDQS